MNHHLFIQTPSKAEYNITPKEGLLKLRSLIFHMGCISDFLLASHDNILVAHSSNERMIF